MKFLLKLWGRFLFFLPRNVQLFLGAMLGSLVFDLLRIRRDVVLKNLDIAFPEKDKKEKISIARQSYINLGRTILEYFIVLATQPKELANWYRYEGLHNVEHALAKKKGLIIVTLHLGNGDLGAMAMTEKGFKMNLITKKAKQEFLNKIWFELRENRGTHLISHEKSTFEILKILKKGECLVWVLDQYMGPPIGVRTRFFGVETGTAQGLALFAERTGAPVVLGYNYRLPNGDFMNVFEPEIKFESKGEQNATIQHMTQVYTDYIERVVRAHPGQWMWVHRRWKKFG